MASTPRSMPRPAMLALGAGLLALGGAACWWWAAVRVGPRSEQGDPAAVARPGGAPAAEALPPVGAEALAPPLSAITTDTGAAAAARVAVTGPVTTELAERLSGVVRLPDGAPLSGAVVRFLQRPGVAITDGEGRFTLGSADRAPGRVQVFSAHQHKSPLPIRGDDLCAVGQEVELVVEALQLLVRAPRPGGAHWRLYRVEGTTKLPGDSRQADFGRAETREPSTELALLGRPATRVFVTAETEGGPLAALVQHPASTGRVEVTLGEVVPGWATLELQPSGPGQDLARTVAHVRLQLPNSKRVLSRHFALGGVCRWIGIAPGRYGVRAELHFGRAHGVEHDWVLTGLPAELELTSQVHTVPVTVTRGGRLALHLPRVREVRPNGLTATVRTVDSDRPLQLEFAPGATRRGQAQPQLGGSWTTVEVLPAGSYRVRLEGPELEPFEASVEVPAGGLGHLQPELRRMGSGAPR
jgi:hypothetical protein